MQINLGLVGADGRMGRTVLKSLGERFSLAAAFVSASNPQLGRTVREAGLGSADVPLSAVNDAPRALAACDVLISFATPAADVAFSGLAADRGIPLVAGTTGHTPDQREEVVIAARRIPIVLSPNFSTGIAVLHRMLASAPIPKGAFDPAIVETHHAGKRDAPSGTARSLAQTLGRALGAPEGVEPEESIPISSIRAGGVPGDHEVILAGTHEVLRIEHRVFSRSAFAEGALLAAEWAAVGRRPGLYSFLDVVGAR